MTIFEEEELAEGEVLEEGEEPTLCADVSFTSSQDIPEGATLLANWAQGRPRRSMN